MDERVDNRYDKLQQKKWNNEKAFEKAAALENMKFQRLKALAETVPYHTNIINIKADVNKTTQARINGLYQPTADNQSRDRCSFQLGAQVSFAEERFFSDFKFKLSHALHEAGFAHTAYSREIVKQLIPREAERTTFIEPF